MNQQWMMVGRSLRTAFATMMSERRSVFALLLGATVLLSGCLLTHPGGTSLAYVEIKGSSIERVRETTVQVFAAERYKVESASEKGFAFVREATLNDRLQYARYDEDLCMRVDVTFEPFGPATILVRADAYAISGGDYTTKLLRIARRPYMKMLRSIRNTAQEAAKVEGE